MVFEDNNSVLKTITPDIFFNKITLETSNFIDSKISNPHINPFKTLDKILDISSGRLKRPVMPIDFFGKTSSIVKPSRSIINKEETSTKLSIIVDLLMIEKFDDSLISSWFGNENFSKYLKIKVLQVTNQNLYKEIFQNEGKIKDTLNEDISVKILSVKDDVLGDKSILTQQETEFDSKGNKIVSFSFRVKFELNNQYPNHLSYFIFSYIDLEQLAKDFKFKIDNELLNKKIEGKVFSSIVIDSGNLVSSADIQDFRNFNDLEKLNLDFSIVENEILNNKIVNIGNNKLSIKSVDTAFTDFFTARDENGNCRFFFAIDFIKILKENCVYNKLFSNEESARQALKQTKILSLKVLRRRVKGSSEIGSGVDITQLFSENQIDDIIIISGEKFYKQFNSVNNSNASLKEIPIIATSNENVNLEFIRYFTGIDKKMPTITDGYYVYGIELEIFDPSYIFIANINNELKEARTGLEKYLNEAIQNKSNITINGNSNPHIDFPGEVNIEKGQQIPGNFNPIINRFSQRFINEQIVRYNLNNNVNAKTPWTNAVQTYITALKIFAGNSIPFEKFEITLLRFVHPASGNPSGILKLLSLMEMLEINIGKNFKNATVGIPPNLGINANIGNSEDISRTGVTTLSKSFNIIKFFKNVYNSNINKNIGYDFLDIDSSAVDTLEGLRNITGDEYNKRIERETDYYYLRQNGIKPDINLKLNDQIFTGNDSIDNTSFSYLTPAKIKLGNNNQITRIGNSPVPKTNVKSLNNISVAAQVANSSKTVQGAQVNIPFETSRLLNSVGIHVKTDLNVNKLSLTEQTKNVLSVRNIVIDPLDEPNACNTIDNKQLKENLKSMLQISGDIKPTGLQTSINRNPQTFENKSEISTIKNFDILNAEAKFQKLLDKSQGLKSAEAFFQGEKHFTTIEQALTRLPNQVKSLFLSRTNPTIVRKNWLTNPTDPIIHNENKTEFSLGFRLINTVQVFNGFEVSVDGTLLMKKPLWEPLTLSLYNASIGDEILCRFISYENKVIGIERDRSLELPIYNEYFLLKPTKRIILSEKNNVLPTSRVNAENLTLINNASSFVSNIVVNNNALQTPVSAPAPTPTPQSSTPPSNNNVIANNNSNKRSGFKL